MTTPTRELVERLRERPLESGCSCIARAYVREVFATQSELNATAASRLQQLEEENRRLREALEPLCQAAWGLSMGEDWNNGTHAKMHGYRNKLLAAIPAARAALSHKTKG